MKWTGAVTSVETLVIENDQRPARPSTLSSGLRRILTSILVALFLTTSVGMGFISTASATDGEHYGPDGAFATVQNASNPDWMGTISDGTSLGSLSIPGTHDTSAIYGNISGQKCMPVDGYPASDVTKVQQGFVGSDPFCGADAGSPSEALQAQLNAGIRSIDIRVADTLPSGQAKQSSNYRLALHHGSVYQHGNFGDDLRVLYRFLQQHPSETVLMHLKLDQDNDHFMEAFNNYIDGTADADPENRDDSGNPLPLESVFYKPSVSGSGGIDMPPLGDVRGKVVLYRLQEGDKQDGNGWGKDAYGLKHSIVAEQDAYQPYFQYASDAKFVCVANFFQGTKLTNGDTLRINYTSAAPTTDGYKNKDCNDGGGGGIPGTAANGPAATAHDVNNRVLAYLQNDYQGSSHTGVVNMDYPGSDLINEIISYNGLVHSDPGAGTDLGPSPMTFKVNAGGVSFAASVSTFTWRNGSVPEQWLTSAGGSSLKYKMSKTRVRSVGGATETIDVNSSKTYQSIDGFGAAMPDSAASLIYQSPKRDEMIQSLFGTGEGQAGFTFARVPMGASDLMFDPNNRYTYEDTPGQFSIDKDWATRDVLKNAKQVAGGDLKIIGTPWSAPGWMKYGGKLIPDQCGTSNYLSKDHFADYAQYFKKYSISKSTLTLIRLMG